MSRTEPKNCQRCGKSTAWMPTEVYGYCSYTCMEANKPEAFAGPDTDHNALIDEGETPLEFTLRLLKELGV